MSFIKEARAAWKDFAATSAATHASSISYYTFFSIVPLLALCISLISLTGVNEQEVHLFFMSFVPEALIDLADALVLDAFERSGIAISLSTLSLLWAASKGAKALRAGLNSMYAEQENRNVVAVAIISLVAVIALGLLLAAAVWLVFSNSALLVLSRVAPRLYTHSSILELVDSVSTLALGVLVLTLCYTYLPAGNRPFKEQLPGAVCAVVGGGILSFGFRLYVDNFSNFTVLYGSIATVALLLFWMYLVFYILLAGGFLNRYLHERPSDKAEDKTR